MTQKFHTRRRGLRSTRLAISGRKPYRKVADGNPEEVTGNPEVLKAYLGE